jgi:hypothetical protein
MLLAAARGELSRAGGDFADAVERWMCIETVRHLSSDAGARIHMPACTGVTVHKRLGVDYDALDIEMSFQGRPRGTSGSDTLRSVRTTVRAFAHRTGEDQIDLVLVERASDTRWYLAGEAITRDGRSVIDDSLCGGRYRTQSEGTRLSA